MDYGALLLGDHPILPAAEVAALYDVHDPRHAHTPAPARLALRLPREVASRITQRLAWGKVWTVVADDEEGRGHLLPRAIRHWASGTADAGTPDGVEPGQRAAVRALTYGPDKVSASALEREIGSWLVEAGHTIDLKEPDLEVFAWAGEGKITVGRLLGGRDPSYWDRCLERRAHFSPIGLHPRRAANLVHLARVAPGSTVYDPFCGTGGIVLEAAILGFRAMGSDIDAHMVQGTMQTLTDAGPEAYDADVFQADIGDAPDLVGQVDAVVTDLPYGTASSTHDEDIGALYARALAAFAAMLPAGRFAVVGHRDPALLEIARDHGLETHVPGRWQRPEVYEEFVHKSLTRRYAVLQRV